MSLASVTTRGYNPPSASIALVTLLGYGPTGVSPPPPPDVTGPPFRGGAPVWWPGKDIDDDERCRKRAAIEAKNRAEIYESVPVNKEAPVKSGKRMAPPLSVEINMPPRKIVSGRKYTDAWLKTRERFRNKRKKREDSER